MLFNRLFFILILGTGMVSCMVESAPSAGPSLVFKTNQVTGPTVSADSLWQDPNGGLVYYRKKPFSGHRQRRYADGTMKEQTTYVNGRREGTKTLWYPDGTKSYECTYQNGKKQGRANSWWKNGVLRSAANFEAGKAHGVQEQWYASGAIFKRLHLDQGKEAGLQQAWRENGKRYANYEARNGRIYGLKRANLCYDLDNELVQTAP